ncbi:MGH1-like glycoside hydrolase domain-containing protein [Sorangium sp. So ce131]|uniref:MGH1-like glycoside hydrolase domain-containing protein n=1 Tax=Sorangium sp. So ce131 TaxID=3133282 RepID=UPI003F610888
MPDQRRTIEHDRLEQDEHRQTYWKRWGPYLSERQWGTVREDYSAYGDCWNYFPHDHARSRAYRWGEDGLLGICDTKARLCFAIALWNHRDPILKERLFGLTGPEGNHGEDVKECYFYVDSTPTHSYLKGLYKYPQSEFPYAWIVEENRRRSRHQPEFELADTGVFDQDRYFDVQVEYAKASPNDILICITIKNRADVAAPLDVLPTLWFRNTWSWNRSGEGYAPKPELWQTAPGAVSAEHEQLGKMTLYAEGEPELLFTDNETNAERLFGVASRSPYRKDAFHDYLIRGARDAVNPAKRGTKAAAHYRLVVPPSAEVTLRLRLVADAEAPAAPFGPDFDATFAARLREADDFHDSVAPENTSAEERAVLRQAYAGLLWSKQFYHYAVGEWIEGDPPLFPPESRRHGRNAEWRHVYNRDVISMPDKWEYPWYAAWDLAFHMIPFARIDPAFTKDQLVLFLREWYMHPNGQLPAYEFAFGDVNPPVHAWAAWRVYKIAARRGERDRAFLERVFQKLLLNFTWWVNRKDEDGNSLFSGGFLGLDNIGVFDRSRALPTGGRLEQADGTAWMAFFCGTMLSMALELAHDDPVYEDMATKFFGRFIAIVDAMNEFGGTGLWDEQDGFYYDHLNVDGRAMPLRTRSMVGVIPLFAVEVLEDDTLSRLPGFRKRMLWFLENRRDLARHIAHLEGRQGRRLLAVPSRERLERALRYVLDESELLSPYGVRSLSRHHLQHPYSLWANGELYTVAYTPGDSDTGLFGGNSNWRGPVWFPLNFLLVEALERYHHFYGDTLRVECPTGSGRFMTLDEVAGELSRRLGALFLPREDGSRPCHGPDPRFASDPHWRDLVLFSEYFHGDDGRGVGASHQTGWTALAARFIEGSAQRRRAPE